MKDNLQEIADLTGKVVTRDQDGWVVLWDCPADVEVGGLEWYSVEGDEKFFPLTITDSLPDIPWDRRICYPREQLKEGDWPIAFFDDNSLMPAIGTFKGLEELKGVVYSVSTEAQLRWRYAIKLTPELLTKPFEEWKRIAKGGKE